MTIKAIITDGCAEFLSVGTSFQKVALPVRTRCHWMLLNNTGPANYTGTFSKCLRPRRAGTSPTFTASIFDGRAIISPIGPCFDGSEGRQGAPYRVRSHPRHHQEFGIIRASFRQIARPGPVPPSAESELALRFRQGLRLDQQTLSFVAAPALAEAHDHGASGAFRLDPAREQRISGGQKLEIVETDAP